MKGLIYDAGALVAAERSDHKVWAMHIEALEHDVRPIVPTPVLAQVWRGGPQPNLSRLLKGCDIEPFSEESARACGTLLAKADRSDVVDAAVVVSAATKGRSVVTSDPSDVSALADAHDIKITLHVV